MQAPGATWELCPDQTLGLGKACEGESRGGDQGLVSEGLRGAEKGSEGLRDGAGEEAGWPGELLVQVGLKPLRGLVLRALRTGAVATGGMDAGFVATTLAWRATVAVRAAVARVAGMEDLAG